jgi:hypothetical protein
MDDVICIGKLQGEELFGFPYGTARARIRDYMSPDAVAPKYEALYRRIRNPGTTRTVP